MHMRTHTHQPAGMRPYGGIVCGICISGVKIAK